MRYWIGRGPLGTLNYVRAWSKEAAERIIGEEYIGPSWRDEVPRGWAVREVSEGQFLRARQAAREQVGMGASDSSDFVVLYPRDD